MVSIFVRTLLIYILLTVTMKIMGKRELGEMDVGDLVSALLISEIAAIPIDDPDLPLMNAVVPILFILSLEILVSFSKTRCNMIKKYIEGEPAYIVNKGIICQNVLFENRISINEFIAEARSQGVGNPNSIEYAVIEQTGKISILQKSEPLPFAYSVIIDGVISKSEVAASGRSENEILAALHRKMIDIENVFLMTVDINDATNIIIKEEYQ